MLSVELTRETQGNKGTQERQPEIISEGVKNSWLTIQ